jgi:hypothetical protein
MEAMTGSDSKEQRALDRLADAIVRDILEATDEDILAEFTEGYRDPEKNAADMRALFEKAVLITNKRRLKAAQAAVVVNARREHSGSAIDIDKARQRLRRIVASAADAPLTLAARKESELSDSDVLGMLDDLRELGIGLDDDGQ